MKYNVVIGFILLGLSILIGVELSKKYTKKRAFYNDFNDFNQILLSEITYSKSTLPQIIKLNYKKDSVFYILLEDKFLHKVEKVYNLPFLEKKDNAFISEYINKIGNSNTANVTDYVKSVKDRISAYLLNANMEEEKKKPLCIKVSFLIGLICLVASI